jgi:hypothetical protein
MGRYDGEDYADESGYASAAMQNAVRRGHPPADGFPGYPEERMYPVCTRCTHRHGAKENCVGEVGERDLRERQQAASEARELQALTDAFDLLTKAGFEVLSPSP